jgi:hypothetical protein
MDKIWDYLPFIIGLIYLFGRSRKKKLETTTEQPQQSQPEISVEEVLRELMGGQKKEVVVEKPSAPVTSVKKQPVKSYTAEKVQTSKPYNYDDREVYEKANTNLHKPLKGLIETTELEQFEIDLKEAVIYSAILNRPEY